MKERVLGALMGLAVFLPLIYLGGGYFAFCMLVLGILGLAELAAMKGINYKSHIGVLSSVGLASVLIPARYFPGFLAGMNVEIIYYIIAIILLVITVFQHESFDIEDAALLMFGAIYIGFGFRFLIEIRDMGLETIIYQFIVIWSTDIGAYLFGRRFGKRQMAPQVSPNKTWEGFFGGTLLALVVGSLYIYLIDPNLGSINSVWIVTLSMAITGQLGDLVESAYKRHFKVKDSGNFLPGHGGVLDRFDSTIFTSFLFMIWLNLFR
ncbi:phosphatidate cytidylyltransferase [Suicoccus acidiformans]|uniref:Phosphatidate cytidylyltransferase n=1 Tax=Suicoccus acidiformans TaxID=2036206 RepID=A0A347WK60_9LACT|nr:phosphatidate cytidylyltransferase [Suicoccus acidiformans]AXY25467.1 phosphatidate cytidylyltransferase [Suicoccus acidiformans]